jgi:hypothetical protein
VAAPKWEVRKLLPEAVGDAPNRFAIAQPGRNRAAGGFDQAGEPAPGAVQGGEDQGCLPGDQEAGGSGGGVAGDQGYQGSATASGQKWLTHKG